VLDVERAVAAVVLLGPADRRAVPAQPLGQRVDLPRRSRRSAGPWFAPHTHGYGFLGVFAGGLAFRRYEHDHEMNLTVHEGAERIEKLLELAVILLLGSMLTTTGLQAPGWAGWLVAVLLLAVVRPLACLLSLVGSRMDHPEEKAFVAWFGVRGVGTLYYLAAVVSAGVLPGDDQRVVVWTCIAAVLISIVVHGITAGPSLRRLLLRRRPARPLPSPRARR
jgi:NhaP-type Na+/H+ or K+/H+ antiporter